MLSEDPRRRAILNEALNRIYEELKRTTPAQAGRGQRGKPSG